MPENLRKTLIFFPPKSQNRPVLNCFCLCCECAVICPHLRGGHSQMVTWCLAAPASTRWRPEGQKCNFYQQIALESRAFLPRFCHERCVLSKILLLGPHESCEIEPVDTSFFTAGPMRFNADVQDVQVRSVSTCPPCLFCQGAAALRVSTAVP